MSKARLETVCSEIGDCRGIVESSDLPNDLCKQVTDAIVNVQECFYRCMEDCEKIKSLSTDLKCAREGLYEVVEQRNTLLTEGKNKDAVLIDIASQSKFDELGDDREDADFEGAYDMMIQLARSVTEKSHVE